MFRITKVPSAESLIQYLAKITRVVLSCPLTYAYAAITPTTSMSTDTIEPLL